MSIRLVNGELETLDHRRARIMEILSHGIGSEPLQAQLRHTLAELEDRIARLEGRPAEAETFTLRRAA